MVRVQMAGTARRLWELELLLERMVRGTTRIPYLRQARVRVIPLSARQLLRNSEKRKGSETDCDWQSRTTRQKGPAGDRSQITI